MNRLVLIIVLVLVNSSSVRAVSEVTNVTPSNLATQPLAIRVQHETHDGGPVSFAIYISDGRTRVSRSREGKFTLWQNEVFLQQDNNPTPPMIDIQCRISEQVKEDTIMYEVEVAQELLDRATFTFFNYDASGMPAFDGYRILLGQFDGRHD